MKKVLKRLLIIICFAAIVMILNCSNAYADLVNLNQQSRYTSNYELTSSFFLPIIIAIIGAIVISTIVLIKLYKDKKCDHGNNDRKEINDNDTNI